MSSVNLAIPGGSYGLILGLIVERGADTDTRHTAQARRDRAARRTQLRSQSHRTGAAPALRVVVRSA